VTHNREEATSPALLLEEQGVGAPHWAPQKVLSPQNIWLGKPMGLISWGPKVLEETEIPLLEG